MPRSFAFAFRGGRHYKLIFVKGGRRQPFQGIVDVLGPEDATITSKGRELVVAIADGAIVASNVPSLPAYDGWMLDQLVPRDDENYKKAPCKACVEQQPNQQAHSQGCMMGLYE
jgi:hypothetical protein